MGSLGRFAAPPSGPPFDTLDSVLIDALPVAVYVCGRDARIIRFNQRAVELWGREPTPEDRYCGSLRMIRPDGSVLPHHECPMADVLRTGEAARADVGIERPDGTRINVRVTIVPLTDGTGDVVGAVNTFQDITREKQAEAALQAREADLRDFVENATIALHWVGPDGVILWANQAELDLLGYTRDEYIGHHIAEFHADGEVIREILNCLSAGQTLRNYAARLRCKDGSVRHVLISSNVLWRDGEFVHTRCFTRDVTEIRQLTDAVRQGEQRLRLAVRATHDVIYEMNLATGDFRFDDDVRELFGHAPDVLPTTVEAALRFWSDHLHPDDRQTALESYEAALQDVTAERWTVDYRLRRADGTFAWVAERALIERDADGKAARIVGALQDVTPQKAAEHALRESEARFRLMADTSPLMIWVVDAEGNVQFVNRAYCRFFGITEEALRGAERWYPLLHPEDAESYIGAFHTAAREGTTFFAEARVRRADGRWRWIASYATPRFAADGTVFGFVGTSPDITDMKDAIAQAREASRVKDDFLATVAHELRQPLHAALAGLRLMALRSSREQGERARTTVERQIQHMNRMVEDLLDAARVVRGHVDLRRESVDIRATIRQVAEAVHPLLVERAHRFDVAVPEFPMLVYVDEARIQQVLMNVLANAAKYTGTGGHISLVATRDGAAVNIAIRDSGRGIDPAAVSRIFDLFTRAADDSGGFGIGLAVARRLVELHGGTISARSDGPGRGSEFVVTVPVSSESAAT